MADNDLDSVIAEPSISDPTSSQEVEHLFSAKRREEAVKVAVHRATIIALYVVVAVGVVIFLIRVAHFVLPNNCKWLDDQQLQGIDKFFFSGALGGIVSKHAGKLFNSNQ